MNAPLKLKFYNITKCGYFEAKAKSASFGTVLSVCEHLASFFETAETREELTTYKCKNENSTFPIYINKSSNNNYMIVLWNPTSELDGRMLTLTGGKATKNGAQLEKKGLKSVKASNGDVKGIPGYPTYFWVLPQLNLMINIQRSGWRSNKPHFDKYMRGFMMGSDLNHVTREEEAGKLHFKRKKDSKNFVRAYPKYETRVLKTNTEIDDVKSKKGGISRIVIQSREENQVMYKSLLDKLVSMVTSERESVDDEDKNPYVYYETTFYPDDDSIDKLFDMAVSDDAEMRVGVRYSEDLAKVNWFDEMIRIDTMDYTGDLLESIGYPDQDVLFDKLEEEKFQELLKEEHLVNRRLG